MCGRTACTLTAGELCQACSCKSKLNKFKPVEWMDVGAGNIEYKPSFNVCPTQASPVLALKKHFQSNCEAGERVLVPMRWGFVPPYHKGSLTSHGLSTNNCRSEGMLQSSLYSTPFKRGHRCIVLCDGFYEWQKVAGQKQKQPYFVYLPQPQGVSLEERSSWNVSWDENCGWHGPRMLPMAGLFGQWTSPEGEKIWNYTVVTMESSPSFAEIHTRMPVILDTDAKMEQWLADGSIQETLSVVQPPEKLGMHPVTTAVGNVHYNDASCVMPIDPKTHKNNETASKDGSSRMMANWLSKASNSPAKSRPPGAVPKDVKDSKKPKVSPKPKSGIMANWLCKGSAASKRSSGSSDNSEKGCAQKDSTKKRKT